MKPSKPLSKGSASLRFIKTKFKSWPLTMWVFAGLALICFLMFGYLLVTIPNPMLERDMPKEYADSIPRLAVFYITGMVLGPFLTMAAGSWLVKQHRQSSDLDELPHDV